MLTEEVLQNWTEMFKITADISLLGAGKERIGKELFEGFLRGPRFPSCVFFSLVCL